QLRVLKAREEFVPTNEKVVLKGEEPIGVYRAAHGKSHQLTQVAPGTLVSLAGRLGDWRAIEATGGRRLWIPAAAVGEPGKGRPQIPAVEPLPVTPPTIDLMPTTRTVAASTIKLQGVARHPDRIHDVVVTVKPAGPAQVEEKIFYRASIQGKPAHDLEFSTDVPLEKGSNQILVTARDRYDIETTREILVFRK
ncbi:MAG: hypothetical protein ACPG77_05180, partial [Nannocystaceae bacterium]